MSGVVTATGSLSMRITLGAYTPGSHQLVQGGRQGYDGCDCHLA